MDVKMKMNVIVEEEYGYRYWLWEVKTKTKNALKNYFGNVITPKEDNYWYCVGFPTDHFIGEWKEIEWGEYTNRLSSDNFDAIAHIHEHHDSWIRFSDL
tara:strand:+ start:97 stop:393 length:297 start_codon:yes stop_codon:yes gene_type:complete